MWSLQGGYYSLSKLRLFMVAMVIYYIVVVVVISKFIVMPLLKIMAIIFFVAIGAIYARKHKKALQR